MGDIENGALQLLQQSYHNYCCDIALEYFTIINRAQHHWTCVPLETAAVVWNLFISMNLWISVLVVGTNLTITLYWSRDVHYVAIFCDLLHMQYYGSVKMFAILILQALILQGGDNTVILPNPNSKPCET